MAVAEASPRFNRLPIETYGTVTVQIGQGGFGTVKATDRGYAIKTIDIEDKDEDAIEIEDEEKEEEVEFPNGDMLNEIVFPASLSHPNIIKYHDVYLNSTSVQIVMDRYTGDLNTLPDFYVVTQFQSIAFQLVTAVAYLTSRNIIHRDIKPRNVLYTVCADDRVHCVLADFGLAAGRECTTTLEKWEAYTAPYRPPEILLELTKYTASADVWALGCTLYEVYTGNVLFEAVGLGKVHQIIEKVGGITEASPLFFDFMETYQSEQYVEQDLINRMSPQPPTGSLVPDPLINDLLLRMLNPDPQLRESIFTLQNHLFFNSVPLTSACYHLRRTEINQCADRATIFDRHYQFTVPDYMVPEHLTMLISWLLELKVSLELSNEIFILSVELLYRYLNADKISDPQTSSYEPASPFIPKEQYQLTALMCLYIGITFIGWTFYMGDLFMLLKAAGYTTLAARTRMDSILTTLNYDLCATTNQDRILTRRIRYEDPIISLASDFLVLTTPIPTLYTHPNLADLCLNLALHEYKQTSWLFISMEDIRTTLAQFYTQPSREIIYSNLSTSMQSRLANWLATDNGT